MMPPTPAAPTEGFLWASAVPELRFGVAADGHTACVETRAEPDEVDLLLFAARTGDVVAMPVMAQPPWIVVHDDVHRVGVSRWPGRLLRVRIRPPANAAEAAAVAATNGEHRAVHWRRAHSISVLSELDPGQLFGEHGSAVVQIIEAARSLDPIRANTLAAARDPAAAAAYQRSWRRWDAAARARTSGSPVGEALSVIHHLASLQAARFGAVSWKPDPDEIEDDEFETDPVWAQAAQALAETALAVGNPLAAGTDARILTRAWAATFAG